VEDGILAVLPALVGQSGIGPALIADQAIAAHVAFLGHPAGGRNQIGPQGADGLEIPGPLGVSSSQGDEQAGRVDPAVVEAERDFAQGAHLAAARLMHDLAGRRILKRGGFGRLAAGQIGQDALGQ
jgi:hypothetical protein